MKNETLNNPMSTASSVNFTEEQIEEFSQKAEKGDAEAAFMLYKHFPGTEKGFYWLEISAKNGNRAAQYNLAVILYQRKSFDEALYWAGMAKRNGDEEADRLIYEIQMEAFGGLPITPALSFRLTEEQVNEFSQSAGKGDADAAFKLYLHFTLSISDSEKSRYWLRASAKNGHRIAQYNLAVSLYQEEKFKEALFWAEMAKRNGYEDAGRLINEIHDKL
jgi:TPR repeat protein